MSGIVVIGEPTRVLGFALAGALVVPAETAEEVNAAFDTIGDDTGLLILTETAAHALGDRTAERDRLLTTVIPS